MSRLTIDLNADLGEYPERLADGSDDELMRYITSANIACGAHAGDAVTIEQTLELAKQHNISAGAHPSYPDRANFGRTAMDIPLADLQSSITDQLNEFLTIARRVGVPVIHVKPHGALYHSCNTDPDIAHAVARAVLNLGPQLVLVAQSGSRCLDIYRDMGLHTAQEAFADRAYESDGSLRNRKLPGALLEDPDFAAAQAVHIVTQHAIRTHDDWDLTDVEADTLCIHSDTAGSQHIARAVRSALERAGVRLHPLQRP